MDKKAMLKQAANVLREQKREIDELHEKIARDQKAEAIVRKLIEADEMLADDVLNKLSELRTKPIEELDIMEKAAEMFGSNLSVAFGKLSDKSDISTDPLVNFSNFLMNND